MALIYQRPFIPRVWDRKTKAGIPLFFFKGYHTQEAIMNYLGFKRKK